MTGTRSSTAPEALVLACEQLVAERGFHGVSASDVVRAAGQRNNSAIAYHFGSWDGLLDAVWAEHTGPINEERSRLLSGAGTPRRMSVPMLVSVYINPLVSDIEAHSPSYWARFNEQWLAGAPLNVFERPRAVASPGDHNPREAEVAVLTDVFAQLIGRLTHLPAADRPRRVALMARFVISALAAWERDDHDGQPATALSDFGAELVDLAVALLSAPAKGRG